MFNSICICIHKSFETVLGIQHSLYKNLLESDIDLMVLMSQGTRSQKKNDQM